jgi:hypothetical protein
MRSRCTDTDDRLSSHRVGADAANGVAPDGMFVVALIETAGAFDESDA